MDDRVYSRKWTENQVSTTASFQYHKPFSLHVMHHHDVGNLIALHHAIPSIEETLVTTCWAIRVLQFLLAVTDVNIFTSAGGILCQI